MKDEAGENAMMSNQSQWEGRLKAVKREIKGVRDEMGSRMDGLEAKIDKVLEALTKEIN